MSQEAATSLSIQLLGPFSVCRHGTPLARVRARRGHWLLALLILRHPHPVERSWLAGTLWPDSDEGQALASLRSSLSELREALGADGARLLSPTPQTLALDLEGVTVDLLAFDAAIGREDMGSLEEAVGLYGGPLLEGSVEEWVLGERERREQAYLGALERLATAAVAGGEGAEAERYLREAVRVDPLRESAQRGLMEVLASGGSYAAATEAYRELRARLRGEMNAEPDPETRALYERIRAEARERAATADRRPPTADPASSGAAALGGSGRHHRYSTTDGLPSSPGTSAVSGRPSAVGSAATRVALLYKRHAQPDEQLLKRLEGELTARGVSVFVDRHLAIGVEWAAAIEREIRGADAVIPLLSAASVPSEMLQYEVQIAHEAAREQGRPRLLPVRIGYTEPLPELLAAILDPLEYALWQGPQDDDRLVAALLAALCHPDAGARTESAARATADRRPPTAAAVVPTDLPRAPGTSVFVGLTGSPTDRAEPAVGGPGTHAQRGWAAVGAPSEERGTFREPVGAPCRSTRRSTWSVPPTRPSTRPSPRGTALCW